MSNYCICWLEDLKIFNEALTSNLNEWQTTNKNIQELILNEQELNSKLGRLNDTLVDKCETKDEEIYVKLKAS